ncbi:hypothetical protein [Chryseobacterium sp. 2R14A]|uniref:hypothetical protein n=1 Tax=Chryseobacterium sp. 2R14A TaxID=3380353 RepID=UPI003CE73DBA
MKVIVKPRGKGKTTELIKLSAQTGAYIICQDMRNADAIMRHAHELNLNIPCPITFYDFDNRMYFGAGIKGFLFDNLDDYIQHLSRNVPILAVTLTENDNLPYINKPETYLKSWKKNPKIF